MSAELLTAEQVAEALGIPEYQVKRRTKADKWPCVRFSSKTIRYRPEHVEQIIAMHDDKEAAEPAGIRGQTKRSKGRSA